MNRRRTDRTRIRRTPCSYCFDLPHRRPPTARFGCPGCSQRYEPEAIVPAYQQTASSIVGMEAW